MSLLSTRRLAATPIALAAAWVALAAVLTVPPAAAAPTAAAATQPLDVLVLGDSYSAGNGATDDQGNAVTYGPDGCYRSRVNWSEKYAAALRATGQPVDLVNHACSGGVTADFTAPRVIGSAESHAEQTPAGVTTMAQADASLARRDPCNTHAFPDEEFWTYHATAVVPGGVTTYDCTRNLRPQADFVGSDTDLVLFTMGGNDAGFSTIVLNCFVLKSASGCQSAVEAARALLPTIQQRLITGIAALRAHGLRDDARIVQLGYPWLQVDNDYMVGGYDAGNQVRSLVTDGDAAIAAIVPTVDAGHPGQLTFLTGVPEKFSGHEPDASTPVGNPQRWINQAFDGADSALWYHPNRFGQQAYADLLAAHGTFGARPGGPSSVRARLHVRATPHRLHRGDRVRLRIRVHLTDGTRPRGRLVVRGLPGHHRALVVTHLRRHDHGRLRLTVRLRDPEIIRLRVVYRDRRAEPAHATVRLRRHPGS